MDINQSLAIAYAQVKLREYDLSKHQNPMDSFTDFDDSEIEYFKSAFDYALSQFSLNQASQG